MTQTSPTRIELPAELADRLERAAAAMGMDLATYLAFLQHCRDGALSGDAQDAARFMFTNHGDSLRKLAQ